MLFSIRPRAFLFYFIFLFISMGNPLVAKVHFLLCIFLCSSIEQTKKLNFNTMLDCEFVFVFYSGKQIAQALLKLKPVCNICKLCEKTIIQAGCSRPIELSLLLLVLQISTPQPPRDSVHSHAREDGFLSLL